MNNIIISGAVAEIEKKTVNDKQLIEGQLFFKQNAEKGKEAQPGRVKFVYWLNDANKDFTLADNVNVVIEGSLRQVKYTNPAGEKRNRLNLNVGVIHLRQDDSLHLNTVSICGFCNQAPKISYLESGMVKTEMSLGINKGKNESDWIDVTLWGKTAETAGNYVVARTKNVGILGNLCFQKYTYKEKDEQKWWVKAYRLTLGVKPEMVSETYESSSEDLPY